MANAVATVIYTRALTPVRDRARAKTLHAGTATLVTYAPWSIRVLSALGLGTMVGSGAGPWGKVIAPTALA